MLRVDQPLEIVETQGVKDRLHATIISQSEEHVHSLGATLAPLGRHCDRPLQNLLGSSRSRQPSQHELVSHSVATNDRSMQIPRCDTALTKQIADMPSPRESEEQMLGLDGRMPQHPRLILSQENELR